MNNSTNFLLAAMAALPPGPMIDLLPRGQWRIGPKCGARNARGPQPPSKLDYEALLKPYYGKTYRHKFTGQVRKLFEAQAFDVPDTALFGVLKAPYRTLADATKLMWRHSRKALDWLRNAEEV